MDPLTQAQEHLAAVGTDNAPTAAQLSDARSAFVSAAKLAKEKRDRDSLAAMLEAIKAVDLAIDEVTKLEAAKADEFAALTAEFPELADEPAGEELGAKVEEKAPEGGKMLSAAEAIKRLGLGPVQVNERPAAPETSQTLSIGGIEATDASWGSLGEAFAKHAKSGIRAGRATLATIKTEYATKLSGKVGDNTRILDDLSREAGNPAVVAAGGCCTLAEPIRDIPMLATLGRPIAASLPTVGASAGAVTFFPPVCLPQEGVATWTCEQDADVDPTDESTWKQCVEVDCDESQEEVLDAIYKCLTIGNFNQRFAPERWNAVLHAAAAAQARLSEQTLFNKIANNTNTTKRTVADAGSVYYTVLNAAVRAWAIISQNQRYTGRRANMIMPSWVKDAAAMDVLARGIKRGRAGSERPLEQALAEHMIDVTWSDDISPIEATTATGPLGQFPATFVATLNVDGGVFRLDGGELNLGTEIRDHDLNRQNKVAAFAETFETAVVRSCDTMALTIPVTVCDAVECFDEVPGTTAAAPLFTSAVPAGE